MINNSGRMDPQVFLLTAECHHLESFPESLTRDWADGVEQDLRIAVPFAMVSFSVISIARGQVWTENIK